MRDIRFRAWNKTLNKFVCWYQQGLSMVGDTGELYLSGSMNVTDKFVLQQFTGLQDKNGVDIYEGDCLLIKECRIAEVIFHNEAGCWDLTLRNILSSLPIGAISPSSWKFHTEVIGNIYENPELLEQ